MPRELHAIIAHIRAVSANPSISTTLIQTEDLEVLCSAAEGERDGEWQLQAVLNRYRYAVAYAAADAWDLGIDIRQRFEWARSNDPARALTDNEIAGIGKEFHAEFKAAAPPPETRAAEEWISRDDHIAAMEALRAEYMQRLLGSEPTQGEIDGLIRLIEHHIGAWLKVDRNIIGAFPTAARQDARDLAHAIAAITTSRPAPSAEVVGERQIGSIIEKCAKIADPWPGYSLDEYSTDQDRAIVKVRKEIAAHIRMIAATPLAEPSGLDSDEQSGDGK